MLCFSFWSYLKDGMPTTVYEGQCAVIKYVNCYKLFLFVFYFDLVVYKMPESILLTEHFSMAITIFGPKLGLTTAK